MPATNKTSRQRQSGAAAIMGVLMLTLLVLFAVLALDSGRLWMQQRQLQSATDIAAIEAARQIGCASSMDDVIAAAQQAAAANGFGGSVSSSPNSVVLGSTSGGVRAFTPGGSTQAVQVILTQDVPASIVAGGLFNRRITLQTVAVSLANTPVATFSVGTSTLRLDTQQSALLNGLFTSVLGGNVNLDLVSYRGLADTNIKLLDLVRADGSIGNVKDLLALNTSVGEFLNLISYAAAQSGEAALLASEDVQALVSAVNRDLNLNVGDVLSITHPDPNAVVDASINLLSLITTTVFVANGQNAITVPLGINIGSIVGVNALVRVIEPSKVVIGPPAGLTGLACTTVSTAQVRAEAGAFVVGVLDLKLNLEVAQGSASLQAINRTNGGSSTEVLIDAEPGLAALTLTNNAGSGPASVLLGLATVSLNLPIANGTATSMTFEVDNPIRANLPQLQSSNSQLGSGLANALGQQNAITVSVLGLDLLGLVGGVVNTLVRPLLVAIATTLLDPLLKLLGIEIGVVDVKLEDVKLQQRQPLVI
ncbi:TadG family pilus assembly protein [Methylobacillus flagellatus]|uniref:TadG family pilus assembly protein n=1 Tax=Methylobacillus flagellatus TaxID=405 RepID=UPI0010F9D956|nr:TadG family pilus assembly protein [Methylobacillus flagellatus]